jgi:hypothetical protein
MENTLNKRANKFSLGVQVILSICFLVFFSAAKYLRYFTQAGDGASYVGLISSVRRDFQLNPYLYSSILKMNQNAWNGVDYWCASNFTFSIQNKESVLQWHAYLIAYPLGLISRLTQISPTMIASIAEASALVVALAICFNSISRNRRTLIFAVLVLGILLTSPILSIGSSGQLQPERLLILPVIVLLTQVEKLLASERIQKLAIFSAFIFGSMISERSALTLFWLTFVYLGLRSPKSFLKPFSNVFIMLATASFCWWLFWTIKYQNSFYYNQVSLKSIFSGLQHSFTDDSANTIKMFLVLTPLIALSFFRWQGLIVGIISLVPNLAVSVGGAEKTGLGTHYHAIYFSVFFATAALGAVELSKRLNRKKFTWEFGHHYSTFCLVFLILFNLSYSGGGDNSPKKIKTNTEQTLNAFGINLFLNFEQLEMNRAEMIGYVEGIPIGSRIASPEWTMPALVDQGHFLISYYPLGVRNSDVVFAEFDAINNQVSYLPWIMDQSMASEIGKCILNTIDERGEDYESILLRPDLLRINFLNFSND